MDVEIDRAGPSRFGLTGILVTPPGGATAAGVVLIGGSEGGLHERDAVVLAGEGFTVLALAYFGAEGVPPVLKDVPLEYFYRAIDFLRDAGSKQVGFLGGSRGGEASLLVASRDERVAAVASVVGSGILTQGIDYSLGSVDRIMGTPTTAWTEDGRPLPYLANNVTDEFAATAQRHGTVRLADAYSPIPDDPAELERVSIPIERSRAAVLLISASDDLMWDSRGFSAVAADRLERHGHPFAWEHAVFEGAGHAIAGPPGAPITSSHSPGPGVTFDMGGDPVVTTQARIDAWQRSVEFLREHLRD